MIPRIIEIPTSTQSLIITILQLSIPVLLAVAGFIVGYIIAIKQVEKTFLKQRELEDVKLKRQLEIEASIETIEKLMEAGKKCAPLVLFPITLKTQLSLFDNPDTRIHGLKRLTKLYDEFIGLRQDATSALLDFIYHFHKKAIILNKIEPLCSKIRDEQDNSFNIFMPYQECLLKFYNPKLSFQTNYLEVQIAKVREQLLESGKKIEQFYGNLCNQCELASYKIQNLYLGKLFDYQLTLPQLQAEEAKSASDLPPSVKSKK